MLINKKKKGDGSSFPPGGRPPSSPNSLLRPKVTSSQSGMPAAPKSSASQSGMPQTAKPGSSQQGLPTEGNAQAPATSQQNMPAVGEGHVPSTGLKASMSSLPSADILLQQERAQQKTGKDPCKVNVVFELVLPIVLACGLGAGFVLTVKQVKDKTEIYGISADEKLLEIKDKSLASEKVLVEVAKLEPLLLLERGDNAQAVASAKALVAKDPKGVRSLLCAGKVLLSVGNKADKEKGLAYMAEALEIAPYSKYVRFLYAGGLAQAGKENEAIEQYEKIVKLFGDGWTAPERELACLYMRTARSADAVACWQNILKSDPSDASSTRFLGIALAQDGKQQEGFEEFQQGFTREQDLLGYPYAVKEIVETHAGLLDAAIKDVERKLKRTPEDPHTMVTLARLYIGKGKIKEARDLMESARAKRELDPEVHEVLAEVMCRQNQSQSGFDEFRMAVNNWHLKN